MSYPNWVFSMFSFIGFALCCIPLPWHLEAWNTGTCLYMIWTALACLNQFVNSIVWNVDAINRAPIWCDVSSRFIVGYAVAVPAASLCINRRLYYIATSNSIMTTKAEKRRAVLADLAIGLGIPVLQMVLQYIAQGHRFNIFEQIGCFPFTYNTPVAYVLVFTWPIIIGLISAVYCVLSIRAFNQRRAQFKELLSANSNLSANRYFRLMCLAGIDILCTVPLGTFVVYLDIKAGVNPWKGWADTHLNFSNVSQFPALIWRFNKWGEASLEMSRWSAVICAIVFFGFFGFADEARKNYNLAINTVAKKMGYSSITLFGSRSGISSNGKFKVSSGSNGHSSNGHNIPVFVNRNVVRKHDSLDSFTNMTSFNEKSFGAISFNDVGGALSKDKEDQLDSPTSSSDASSFLTTIDDPANAIEISSQRKGSDASTLTPPREPEPSHQLGPAPQHTPDTPTNAFRHSFVV